MVEGDENNCFILQHLSYCVADSIEPGGSGKLAIFEVETQTKLASSPLKESTILLIAL
jgi:hypothetical protein